MRSGVGPRPVAGRADQQGRPVMAEEQIRYLADRSTGELE